MAFGVQVARRWAPSLVRFATAAVLAACGDKAQPTAVRPDTATRRAPSDSANRDTRDPRPNIVFLLADDMRNDVIAAHGNPIIKTPNLDQLARQGVSFRNAYVTTPVCAISRASIFTGQFERRHGINDFDTDLDQAALARTYPLLLRAAGYRTGFIGKFGVGNHPPANAFDYWRGFPGQGEYEQHDSAGKPIHLTALMAQQAIAFLQSQPRDKPFVLSVSFKAPHVQDESPKQFIVDAADEGLYSTVTMPTPPTAGDQYWQAFPQFFRDNNLARMRWTTLFSTPDMYQASVKGYYRLITGLDRAIGQIRDALHDRGLDSNTVIIFSSDNGFMLGELGLSHKWFGFEPSVRVPLIISDPRIARGHDGRSQEQIALNIDLAPTMLELAGVSTPPEMEGRSLIPFIRGNQVTSWRTDFLFEHLYPEPTIRRSAGVIGGRYKYLRYLDPTPNYESLYDLSTDPNETMDLARDERYQSVLQSLRLRYDQLVAAAR